MPGYIKRPAELIARIDEINPQVPEAERPRIRQGLMDYLNARKDALTQMLGLLEDLDSDSSKESAWRDRVDRARDDLNRYIGDALNGVSEASLAALGFRALTLQAEHRFWEGLREIKVTEKRAQITVQRKKLEQMTRELDEKWRAIDGVDDSLFQEQVNVVRDIQRLSQEALEQTTARRRSIQEWLAKVTVMATDWAKQLPAPQPVKIGAELLRKYLQYFGPNWVKMTMYGLSELKDFLKPWEKGQYQMRLAIYQGQLIKESGVHVLFAQTYRDTQEFVKTNGFDAAKALYQQAYDALGRWTSGLPSGAVRDDAEAFAKDALERLSSNLSRTEASFNDFVGRHKGKFFGGLSDEIKESLCEVRAWENEVMNLKSLDLETQLRRYRDEANTFFLVDLEGPLSWPEKVIREREDLSNADKDELVSMYRAYADEIRRQIREQCDQVVRGLEESQRVLSARELEESLKRSLLIDKLPS